MASDFPEFSALDQGIYATVAHWSVRHRVALFVFGMLVTAALFPLSLNVQFDRSVRSLFPPRHPRLLDYQQLVETFEGDAICLAVYSDAQLLSPLGMARLTELAGKLQRVPGILKATSLAEQPLPGQPLAWSVGLARLTAGLAGSPKAPVAGNRPTTPWKTIADGFADPQIDPATLRRDLLACELYRDLFIGRDGQTTAIVLVADRLFMADGRFRQTLANLRAIAAAQPLAAVLVGSPVMINDVYTYVDQDAWLLTTISLGTMLLVIFFLFRSLRWVLLSMGIVQATLIWTRALMAGMGIQLSIVGSMMTALVTVIGIATTIHVAVRYREEFDRDQDRLAALERSLVKVLGAIFWSCATTAGGFGALAVSDVAPVRAFALVMAAAALFVGLVCLLILPAGIVLGRFHAAPRPTPGETALKTGLGETASAVLGHAWLTGGASVVGLALAALGFRWLSIETDFTKNFRADSTILGGYRFVETHLGGAGVVELVIETPATLTPDFLRRVRQLSADLRRLDGVTKVTALTDLLDFFLAKNAAKPPSPAALAPPALRTADWIVPWLAKLEPALLSRFWNETQQRMLLQLRVREQQTVQGKRQVLNAIEARARELIPGSVQVTGLYVLLVYLIDNLLGDQVVSFAISAAGIFLMTTAAFRGCKLGMIGFLPNVVPIVMVVGCMGWLGMKINVATAMIGSISMGLVVDFSIHYLNRFQQERRGRRGIAEALLATHQSTGRAMVFANLALMLGFAVLIFSRFMPTTHFGMLVSVAIVGGLLGNLVLLPLLLGAWVRDPAR